jgi:hypothetical protein
MLEAESEENKPDYVLDRIDYLIPLKMWEKLGWTEEDE